MRRKNSKRNGATETSCWLDRYRFVRTTLSASTNTAVAITSVSVPIFKYSPVEALTGKLHSIGL